MYHKEIRYFRAKHDIFKPPTVRYIKCVCQLETPIQLSSAHSKHCKLGHMFLV